MPSMLMSHRVVEGRCLCRMSCVSAVAYVRSEVLSLIERPTARHRPAMIALSIRWTVTGSSVVSSVAAIPTVSGLWASIAPSPDCPIRLAKAAARRFWIPVTAHALNTSTPSQFASSDLLIPCRLRWNGCGATAIPPRSRIHSTVATSDWPTGG